VIIWITGLSAAGKTSIGKSIYDIWKDQNTATVLVDGDEVRKILKHDDHTQDYTLDAREIIAMKIHNLCAWLDSQNINVVCCTNSHFEHLRQLNRSTFSGYYEVYVSVPMEVLYDRDTKDLYKPAMRGDIENVIGVDIPFSPPKNPDLIIDNGATCQDFEPLARQILAGAGVV